MDFKLKEKAEYCLSCKTKNCMSGCPLSNDITEAIKKVKINDLNGAYGIFSNTTVLSSICGRICPHKKQCEGKCIRGIRQDSVQIGDIEAYVGDYGLENNVPFQPYEIKEINKSVAVIGSGPAGITCAATLKRMGVKEVVIYEKKNYLGGLLVHGIPEFRLSKDIVKKTYDKILNLGIEVKLNTEFGKDIFIEDLLNIHDKIFIACGANVSSKLNVPGEDLDGVYGANEVLEYNNILDVKNKRVCVNGGGNVAIDMARTLKRKGAKEVIIIYRRAKEQMPAEEKEIKEAIEEGIEIKFLTSIVKIEGKEKVEKIEVVKNKLVETPGQRPSPVEILNSNHYIKLDYLFNAIGSNPERKIVESLNVQLDDFGKIIVDEKYKTSNEDIYAGGDVAGVKQTVAWASMSGREAAKNIFSSLEN